MKVLDCTLRDGGYYNAWDFDREVVDDYLLAIANAGVDMVELGLRNYACSDFKGPYFFTTEAHLADLNLPFGPEYGVMVDAKVIFNSGKTISATIDDLFVPASESKISFVRIACHFSEVCCAEKAVSSLHNLGYRVFINIMQISLRTDEEIRELSELLSGWAHLEGVYFADSLGNMNGDDVRHTIDMLGLNWKGGLGIHTHNNMGQALSNSLMARELGVTYLDATITGMGRGAGNTETELLLAALKALGHENYKVLPLAELVLKQFEFMKQRLGWGPSLHYYIAARYNIHPTYIQKILTDNHFGLEERIAAVDYIPKLAGKTFYDETLLGDLLSPTSNNSAVPDLIGRSVSSFDRGGCSSAVLVGSGSETKRHIHAIKHFVSLNNSKIFAINTGVEELADLIDSYVILHNAKQIDYGLFLKGIERDVVAPMARFTEDELKDVDQTRLIDFPVRVSSGGFESCNDGCVIPFDLTAAYALSAIVTLGFQKVFLIGFDGYGYADSRQKEMSELFHLVRKEYPALELIALTPTTYPVEQESIYAPIL